MVRAMREKDSGFNGQFYIGVHSTGIYCLPSCTARAPLLKNVRFYPSREDALSAGLRGCKRCKSDKYPDVLPDWVKRLITFMRENKTIRLTEHDLSVASGVDITTVRRHFRAQLEMTPLAFHRRQRLLNAQGLLSAGSTTLDAAYESGYESPSGFNAAYKKEFGFSPGRSHAR